MTPTPEASRIPALAVDRLIVSAILLLLVTIVSMVESSPALARECVVLVHGLGRTPHSMATLADSLDRRGYVTVNKGYRSTSQSVEKSAAVIGDDIAACRALHAEPIDFVTHSLGAILVRVYFQDHHIADAGRVVMLAPPNHGSEISDHLKNRWWFTGMLGPAGAELTTDRTSLPNRLHPIGLDIGVIAGTHNLEPWFASYFHGPNDGKVSVMSARLAEMKDFITVDASHTFIAASPVVQDQVANFLVLGKFRHP